MSFLSHSRPREGGFTLIEVLLSVAALAVVASLVALTFTTTFGMLQSIEKEHGPEHQARICLMQITDDLMMARLQQRFPWNAVDGEHDGQPADLLAFVSTSHVRYRDNAPEADLTRVLYARDGDHLIRISLRNLYGILPAAIERVDLATGVVAFNVRYYDGASLVWVDEWDGQSKKGLPRAVMIELSLLNSRNEPRTYIDWAIIPPQAL